MQIDLAYRRRSGVDRGPAGLAIALSPNLRRDRVSFDGVLREPLRFREAVSALHEIVISDLRYKPRDKSTYEAFQAAEQQRRQAIYTGATRAKRDEIKAKQPLVMPDGLEGRFRTARKQYWRARQKYSNYLLMHDRELWRLLMPCDPVMTVAPDSLFFECFSADESSYGCLSVSREAFKREDAVSLGTTNVDYTWPLYEHFQTLRSYRETRFTIDPQGFDVATTGTDSHREEKVDLPNSWLRGFMQLQSAMSLPMRRVPVSREGLYNVLAFLRRHKAARSPRAVRFELMPGQPVRIVLEPWEQPIELHSTPYDGPRGETIRVWGRDRLRVLARTLPITDSADVYLLGNGLPSFWVTQMGDMRLTLGLSGWTTNDWTAASALTQLMPPTEINEVMLTAVAAAFKSDPVRTFDQLTSSIDLPPAKVAASLNRLALLGQVIHDLPHSVYRWRQVMPVPLTAEQVGGDDKETVEARVLIGRAKFDITRDEVSRTGMRLIEASINDRFDGNRKVEMVIDGDGRITRGQCKCSHHFTGGLRRGPCRHLQAVRNHINAMTKTDTLDSWYQSFWN
ncbi:hypothetical protein Poly51_14850 [Rubripirellula tenax]|uniref:SWIM-type domain-containing protein n=1 Tax=Rubripirellula tenax TaxID=2528015 RepID=A0A5C6FB94_9BACT|nr:hypothetical protein [Rubripirellula tenax]TWU58705.1 hypothetical protein Poly51_14850 [Rubripirellula tenax]